jgi:hypothetical protein
MPTITNTDADWLFQYSAIMNNAMLSLQPDVNAQVQGAFTFTVTLTASESFGDFLLEMPFQLPANTIVGQISWDNTSLSLSYIISENATDNHNGLVAQLTGSNTSDEDITVIFTVNYMVQLPLPFSI